jgi:hypothetical protein
LVQERARGDLRLVSDLTELRGSTSYRAQDLVVVARLANLVLASDELQRLLEQGLAPCKDVLGKEVLDGPPAGPHLVLGRSAEHPVAQELLLGGCLGRAKEGGIAVVERLDQWAVRRASEHRPVTRQELLHERQRAAADHEREGG